MAAPNLKSLGLSGLTRQGGYVYEEPLRELAGDRWRRVQREMIENDSIINAVLFAIEMLIRQTEWDIVLESDTPEDEEAAQFIGECLHDMTDTWPDTLSEILSFLPWGWAVLEILYKFRQGDSRDPRRQSKYTDGRIGWRRWGIRAQETADGWEWDDEGRPIGMWQRPPPDYERRYIPLDKALHFRATSRKANPESRSILRGAYIAWYFRKHIQQVEGIGIERDLAGLPMVRIPAQVIDAASTQYTAWKEVAVNLRRDEQEGLVIPSDRDEKGNLYYDVTLLTTGGQRQFDTDKVLNRYKAEIAMSVMADFLVLGHEKVGSFALASSKTDLFAVALGAWLDSIAATINEQAIAPLLRLNGMRGSAKLVHGDVESVDLAELGTYIKELAGVGVDFSDPELQRHLLQQAALPVPEEEATPRRQQQRQQPEEPEEDEEQGER